MPSKNYKDDPTFREFVRFMATPKWEREKRKEEGLTDTPVTQKEFAEQHDVHCQTLSSWKKTDAYRELMDNIAEHWLHDAVPQVIQAAKEVAVRPDPKGQRDREMLLKVAGLLGSNTVRHVGEVDHVHSVEDARTMDEEELRHAYKERLRQQDELKDKSEAELDAMVNAAFGRPSGTNEKLPTQDEEVEDADYVLVEPGPEDFDD